MSAETRTIGDGYQFSTRTACKDDIVNDYGGDLTGEGIQTCLAYLGGIDGIYNERVDWSGITCTSSDYIILQNMNSFIQNSVATFRHGNIFRTTSTLYVIKMAEYMILDGFNIIHDGNSAWGYGAVTPNNHSIVKNCFISARSANDSGMGAAMSIKDITDVLVANSVILQNFGDSYSLGIHTYKTTGSMTIEIIFCDFLDLFASNATARNHLRVQGDSNLHVKVYNSIFEEVKGFNSPCVQRFNSTEDLDCYNCITGDGSAYGGSGNLTNKDIWKDIYKMERSPIIWSQDSIAYEANYNLNAHSKKAHFQNDIHGNERDLTAGGCCIGSSEFVPLSIYENIIRRDAAKMIPTKRSGVMKTPLDYAGKMYPRR